MSLLERSAVLGLAAGGQAAVGVAVPVRVATRGSAGPGARRARAVVGLAVLGELVGDVQPTAPSRLEPQALIGRTVSGAAGAGWLAHLERRAPAAVALAALAGAAGAIAGSVLGASWRQAAESTPALQPDWRAALLEDVVVLTAAGALVATAR